MENGSSTIVSLLPQIITSGGQAYFYLIFNIEKHDCNDINKHKRDGRRWYQKILKIWWPSWRLVNFQNWIFWKWKQQKSWFQEHKQSLNDCIKKGKCGDWVESWSIFNIKYLETGRSIIPSLNGKNQHKMSTIRWNK